MGSRNVYKASGCDSQPVRTYILLLETPPADARYIYCGQAHGDLKEGSVWSGLPLPMKTYEQQSRVDSDKPQALRQTRGEAGKTLHICRLCSLPGVSAQMDD